MKSFQLFLLFTATLSLATAQLCNNYTIGDATNFINENLPVGDGTDVDVTINEWIINCLATAGAPNKYSSVTFSARFTRSTGTVFRAQADVVCVIGNQWNVAGTYGNLNENEFNSRISAPPRVNCSRCAGAVAPANEVTHCVGKF